MEKKICCKIFKCFNTCENIICFTKRNRCKKGEISFVQLQNIYYIDTNIISNITIYLQNSYNNNKIYYNFKYGSYCNTYCKIKMNLYNCMYGCQTKCIDLTNTFDCIKYNCSYNCNNSSSCSNTDSSSSCSNTDSSSNSCSCNCCN